MKKGFIFIAGLLVFAFSCEKVIDIPLNEAEQRIVVEAVLFDVEDSSFIKLSKTGSVYDNSDFEKISGATVTVSDDQGNTFTFIEDPLTPGLYLDTTFIAQPYRTYDLSIIAAGETITATSTTYDDIQFDSLDYFYQAGSFGNPDSSYFVFFNFTDNGADKNFYRAVPVINGAKSGTYYLTDDKLFNGNNYRQPFFAEEMGHGDTLIAYIVSMDEANYTYLNTLSSNGGGGPFSPTPSNPVSNLEGNAIGFFGVFMTGYEQIIFP
ncbi:MAG: DUF4249 domain-containing protein [Crocinitomicaceae bacterium]